jgi:hypothetical protein
MPNAVRCHPHEASRLFGMNVAGGYERSLFTLSSNPGDKFVVRILNLHRIITPTTGLTGQIFKLAPCVP